MIKVRSEADTQSPDDPSSIVTRQYGNGRQIYCKPKTSSGRDNYEIIKAGK